MATKRTLHRSITERWVVTGTLVLETPAHFGNGDADPLTDMPLLVDEVDDQPLLTGASIAGALRNYLRERALGFGEKESGDSLASELFGGYRGDDDGDQSQLVVFDAPGTSAGFELRDGVAIDAETRTAADEKKFDMQLLAAGSSFDLRFELMVSNGNGQALRDALATALHGLEKGEITLGARKKRGFGQVMVGDWQIWKYDLQTKAGLLAWLSNGQDWRTPWTEQSGATLVEKLGANLSKEDKREIAHLCATFALDGTLMIRSGFGESDNGPDMVHLHSPRPKKDKPDEQEKLPVIPGTSWAGILRHRALKIARTISGNDKETSQKFVDAMFGPSKIEPGDKHVKASRVSIKESEITDSTSLVVTRVKIDRFTGGAFESALFSEQPAIGKPETRLTLDLALRTPSPAELGLLLLLLKDLWTGDLPIGGESGVGRGRLKGICATLTTPDGKWEFKAGETENSVTLTASENAPTAQSFVDAFNKIENWTV
jgi:CRISPR/Cas system CSM-associated protein Csm3 (group 7 of RAMP superfamily)